MLSARNILDDIGLSYVWLNQYVTNERAFIADATARIQAVFLQENYAIINTSIQVSHLQVVKRSFLPSTLFI
jgi:hypothetical protein